ncbi:MAG: type II secretion system major pseudopilin GspG [Planctomycetota bacterium]|nr:type II secretion system major pseudopilin GspG [Planctomycetota bacterium]
MRFRDSRDRARSTRRPAFTIIEIIVVVIIIGVIAAVIAPRLIGRVGQSKQSVAKVNATSLANAVKSFMLDHGKPETGATINILWERPSSVEESKWEPYVDNADALLDPWGKPYVLLFPGQKNVDFDVISYGRDGQPGGEGEDADVIAP